LNDLFAETSFFEISQADILSFFRFKQLLGKELLRKCIDDV